MYKVQYLLNDPLLTEANLSPFASDKCISDPFDYATDGKYLTTDFVTFETHLTNAHQFSESIEEEQYFLNDTLNRNTNLLIHGDGLLKSRSPNNPATDDRTYSNTINNQNIVKCGGQTMGEGESNDFDSGVDSYHLNSDISLDLNDLNSCSTHSESDSNSLNNFTEPNCGNSDLIMDESSLSSKIRKKYKIRIQLRKRRQNLLTRQYLHKQHKIGYRVPIKPGPTAISTNKSVFANRTNMKSIRATRDLDNQDTCGLHSAARGKRSATRYWQSDDVYYCNCDTQFYMKNSEPDKSSTGKNLYSTLEKSHRFSQKYNHYEYDPWFWPTFTHHSQFTNSCSPSSTSFKRVRNLNSSLLDTNETTRNQLTLNAQYDSLTNSFDETHFEPNFHSPALFMLPSGNLHSFRAHTDSHIPLSTTLDVNSYESEDIPEYYLNNHWHETKSNLPFSAASSPSSSTCYGYYLDHSDVNNSSEISQKNHNNTNSARGRRRHLLQFIVELLLSGHNCVEWVSQTDRVFHIVNPDQLTRLWGRYKNNTGMTFESLSRSLRLYYAPGKLERIQGRRHHYRILVLDSDENSI